MVSNTHTHTHTHIYIYIYIYIYIEKQRGEREVFKNIMECMNFLCYLFNELKKLSLHSSPI